MTVHANETHVGQPRNAGTKEPGMFVLAILGGPQSETLP